MDTTGTPSITDLEQPYLTYLATERQVRPSTLQNHSADLHHFLAWQATRPWDQVLEGYFAAHPAWARETARIKRVRLNQFLKYARKKGHPGGELRAHDLRPRNSTRAPRTLKQADIDMIFAAIPPRQVRDALLFRLLYFAQLRVSEVARLRVEDVQINTPPSLAILFIRNDFSMGIEIEQAWLAEHFPAYLKGRTAGDYLFRAAKHGGPEPLVQQNLYRRWTAYAQGAQVQCSLEDLRISGLQHFPEIKAKTLSRRKVPGSGGDRSS